MAGKIIWSKAARQDLTEVLEYWNNRNKSKTYSQFLLKEIGTLLQLLLKFPFLGLPTDKTGVRIKIFKNFKIFYEVRKNSIWILRIWDTRQNPKNLDL
ncbi:MAG: type II toxin-antitoxin system RelE/ParE family toxin [Fulvivirga sp.]